MRRVSGTAPGIEFNEQIEQATKSLGVANAIGIVGVAKKGPLELTFLTSPKELTDIFGEAPAINSAVRGALAILKKSKEVWFQRVVSKSAIEGSTWRQTQESVEGESMGILMVGETTVSGTINSKVVPNSILIDLAGEEDIVDDGKGGLVQSGVTIGNVDYVSGEIELILPEALLTDTEIFINYSYMEGSEGDKPWIVFTTKEVSEVYNGYTVNLSWENFGTEDDPKWKVFYVLRDTAGREVESYRCDESEDGEVYIKKVLDLYSGFVVADINGEPASREPISYTIQGGHSGMDATVDDIIGTGNTGMKAFYDPEIVDISTLIVPTWADQKVWEEGCKIGEYRKDIVFIPSMPIGLTPDMMTDLSMGVGEYMRWDTPFDRTFVPLYWPNGTVKNTKTGKMEVVDIVPYIAATYAHSDNISNIWFAPAGIKRGIIEGIDGLEYRATKEERDQLYSTEVNVNSVVDVRGYGITIMGARTSKIYEITAGNTALRYINVRRMCNYIRKVVVAESLHNLFDQNDYYTWNDWKMRIDPYLRTIKEGRGLYDYEIIMDETTVTPADIAAGRMPGKIKVAPIKPAEYIIIDFIVAKDGTVSFSEEVVME